MRLALCPFELFTYKGDLEGSGLFFTDFFFFFGGAFFPCFFNLGKIKSGVCSFCEFLVEVSYIYY